MNENSTFEPYIYTPPSSKRFLPVKIIVICLIALFLFSMAFFALSYFKIIPVNFLNKPSPAEVPSQPIPVPKLVISCPVPEEYCQTARVITYQERALGWGFTIPANTPISAAFQGTLENGMESGGIFKIKAHPVRWLHGQGEHQGYIATYNMFADPVSSFGSDKLVRVFAEGETIATTSSQTFPQEEPFSGISLIFSLTKEDKFASPLSFEFDKKWK